MMKGLIENAQHLDCILESVSRQDGISLKTGGTFGDWELLSIIDWQKLCSRHPDLPPPVPGVTHLFFFRKKGSTSDLCLVNNGQSAGPKMFTTSSGGLEYCPRALVPFCIFPWT
jgi:hypothetical protein